MRAAIVYAKLSPYHIARLEAAGARGAAEGHQLIGIEVADSQANYRWPKTLAQGLSYRRITLFSGGDYLKVPFALLAWKLYRVLDAVKPDVVFLPGWGMKETLASLLTGAGRKWPLVLISDSREIDNRQTRWKTSLKRSIVGRFDSGFAGGGPHVRYLEKLGMPRERCTTGCDVVDNRLFESATRLGDANRQRNEWVLLSCLRMLPRKNIHGVLASLSETRHPWHWVLAGDGPDRDAVEEAVRTRGLGSRVQLLGHVDYFSLPQQFQESQAYLQPSFSEPWALAVNEAMASGLPVVVSNRCGCREDLVREGLNGFTFDPFEPGALTVALNRLGDARERWLEMGAASRAIVSKWGLDRFADGFWEAAWIANGPGAKRRIARKPTANESVEETAFHD